jgi:rhamnose utilization protein RhaD (predicted bifunctional aldolase and dehydrogenase)
MNPEVRIMTRNGAIPDAELWRLLDLALRVGSDPLLTQASTGNISIKRNGVLWIKASGRWMADAASGDILIPLDLTQLLNDCLRRRVDPADCYLGASTETALHAVLPHRIVLHVHCVNTIAWAVRCDGAVRLEEMLQGLSWRWVPYVASGLPLSHAVERVLYADPDTDVFILGNHGLVVCGNEPDAVEQLLDEVIRRVSIPSRALCPHDYVELRAMSRNSGWTLPEDERIHTLGTDPISRRILAGGILYPCQAIFSDISARNPFLPSSDFESCCDSDALYSDRPFRIFEGRGILVSEAISSATLAMLCGLAEVLQRLHASAPVRYLTELEIAAIPRETVHRYRELASVRLSPAT